MASNFEVRECSASEFFSLAYDNFSCVIDCLDPPTQIAGSHALSVSSDEQAAHAFLTEINDNIPPDSWREIFVLGDPPLALLQHLCSHESIRIQKIQKVLEDVVEKYPFLKGLKTGISFPCYPDEVMDHLYIGSALPSTQQSVFDHLNITAVVNLTSRNRSLLHNPNFNNYLYFNVSDDESQNITEVFDRGIPFIEKAISRGENVLVHCQRGRSRSGILVVAYVMKTMDVSFDEALQFIQRKRPEVQPNPGFERQVKKYFA